MDHRHLFFLDGIVEIENLAKSSHCYVLLWLTLDHQRVIVRVRVEIHPCLRAQIFLNGLISDHHGCLVQRHLERDTWSFFKSLDLGSHCVRVSLLQKVFCQIAVNCKVFGVLRVEDTIFCHVASFEAKLIIESLFKDLKTPFCWVIVVIFETLSHILMESYLREGVSGALEAIILCLQRILRHARLSIHLFETVLGCFRNPISFQAVVPILGILKVITINLLLIALLQIFRVLLHQFSVHFFGKDL